MVEGESEMGGAGVLATAERNVYIGSSGFVLARVATADSWEPSKVAIMG